MMIGSKDLPGQLFLAILLTLLSGVASADVWTNENHWNDDWESRFSDWVQKRYTHDIFTKGEYAGIAHDCADSAYFARLLFAYENRLPFVIQDPAYEGEGSRRGASFDELIAENGPDSPYAIVEPLISNEMDYYDHLDEKTRVRRFMDFVGAVVWTKSLINDTYPIQLNRKWFRPGVVAALPRSRVFQTPSPLETMEGVWTAGHAQIVTGIGENGVIHYLKSTMPAKVQPLRPTTMNSFSPGREGGSFRYWKQPGHFDSPEDSLPGYGTEQFDLEGVFEDVMQKRLARAAVESRSEKLERLSGEICGHLYERVPVVMEAWRHKLKIGETRCMDYRDYDIHSTPTRDGKIRKTLARLLRVATGNEAGDFAQVADTIDKVCGDIEYMPGETLQAGIASRHLLSGSASSDPNQPPAVRWGLVAAGASDCRSFY